jgi:asparagine synthetase B (glutamine-hydrolysing)
MSLSQPPGTVPVRLPWATEWLASWSNRPLVERHGPEYHSLSTPLASNGRSLNLSGGASTIAAGRASSLACDVFCAGELYNREELCSELHLPQDVRDAELVLSAWEAWGPEAFGRIDGVFAIIVQDRAEGGLWAARDPMGIHPLFFAPTTDGLALSDTVGVLLRHPDVSRDISRLKLAEMSFNYYGEPHETFYKSIYKVPPGHYLRATLDGWTFEHYWSFPDVRPADKYPFEEALDRFTREFAHVVGRSFNGKRHSSILLSGGLDSISIAAETADLSRSNGGAGPIALSLLFPHPDCDEREAQQFIAHALGLSQICMTFEEAVGGDGLVGGGLQLSSNLSAPLSNNWRPAYLPLIDAARRRGSATVLTGAGGDEWLGVSPSYMADLIKRGRFISATRTLKEQLRSFNLPPHSALRFQLWNSGLRPLVVRAIRPMVTAFAPAIMRFVWRRRQLVPRWVAPDVELRKEIHSRLEADIERQFAKQFDRGPYAFYMEDAVASYVHPLSSGDREEDFEVGKLVKQRFFHPYWDARLIRCLCEIPPEWLAYNGYSKGLVRGTIAERFPGLGLEKKKKVSAARFYAETMRRELPAAWQKVGGPTTLSKLGVVDRSIVGMDMPLEGDARELHRVWFLLNMESWARTKAPG